MSHRDVRFSIKLAFVVLTLLVASAARASLLDCTHSPAVDALSGISCSSVANTGNAAPIYVVAVDTPSIPVVATQASFEIDQTRRSGFLANSVPLLLLIGVFIAFLLLRAKRFNTK